MSEKQLIIVGASARAACYSASRAGYDAYWIDMFGDYDLKELFPGSRVKSGTYPGSLIKELKKAPQAPFIYTGAIENHLTILDKLEKIRSVYGNTAAVCRDIRNPHRVADCLNMANLGYAKTESSLSPAESEKQSWLVKPLHGSGGAGIREYRQEDTYSPQDYYLQEFLPGISKAGIYLATGSSCNFLGVTRQLTGESFLHAEPYAYCGSIGPLKISSKETIQWQSIGKAIADYFNLRGLFCVDAIDCEGEIKTVEVNPRYSASVEVLELAREQSLMKMHCQVFEGNYRGEKTDTTFPLMFAKAYLFAHENLICPKEQGRLIRKRENGSLTADIPFAGSQIEKGSPVMSLVCSVPDEKRGLSKLKEEAGSLYREFDVVS